LATWVQGFVGPGRAIYQKGEETATRVTLILSFSPIRNVIKMLVSYPALYWYGRRSSYVVSGVECWEEDGIKPTKPEQLNVSLGTTSRGGVDEENRRQKKRVNSKQLCGVCTATD
jgi:hypothetical protein